VQNKKSIEFGEKKIVEKQIWWSFSYEPMMEAEIELVEWLKEQRSRNCREKVIEAISGYWNAIAALERGIKSDVELKRLGLNCCRQLEQQSDRIRVMFLLPPRGNREPMWGLEYKERNRVKKSYKKKKGQIWTFSYQPQETSPYLELISWFKDDSANKVKAIAAIRGYWLAIANGLRESKSELELKQLGLNCCNMLESQCDYIRAILGLEQKPIYTDRKSIDSVETQQPQMQQFRLESRDLKKSIKGDEWLIDSNELHSNNEEENKKNESNLLQNQSIEEVDSTFFILE